MPSETPDGSELPDAVLTELREWPWALPRENVIISDSVVHRWGVIESEEARRAILTTAEGVPCVKRVEIQIEHPGIMPTYVAETGGADSTCRNLSQFVGTYLRRRLPLLPPAGLFTQSCSWNGESRS